jgi:hypothetical protein
MSGNSDEKKPSLLIEMAVTRGPPQWRGARYGFWGLRAYAGELVAWFQSPTNHRYR